VQNHFNNFVVILDSLEVFHNIVNKSWLRVKNDKKLWWSAHLRCKYYFTALGKQCPAKLTLVIY